MAKVNISSYSGSVVSGNWSPALAAAWAAIKATGGEIHFDQQQIKLQATGAASLVPDTGYYVPLLLTGDGSSKIQVDMGASGIPIYGGNLDSLRLRDLALIGTNPTASYVDCLYAVGSTFCFQIDIQNCIFAGIIGVDAIVKAGVSSALRVTATQFGGCSTNPGGAAIDFDGGKRLVVDDCDFLDYQNLENVYYSKSPYGVDAWIACTNGGASNGANHQTIDIRNSRFDEGALVAIYVDGYSQVNIKRCAVNVISVLSGKGIYLKNCGHVVITHVNAGYNNNDVPAVEIENCGLVEINCLTVDHGINRVKIDANSGLRLYNSPGVIVDAAAGAEYEIDGVRRQSGGLVQVGR
jgi:hypothetical protein